jgi:hypothetical protein
VTPGAPARTVAGIIGAALLIVAVTIVVWEPWHGPIVVSLSSSHGIDAGDAIVLPLVVLSVLVWKAAARPLPSRRLSVRIGLWRWSGPGAAMLLGGLLIVVGTVNAGYAGPLLPAGGGTFGRTVHYAASDESVAVDAWTYLAVTYDGSVLRLYVNGREVASHEVSERLEHSTLPLWIGGNEPYGEHFDGEIDELRIYARTLTAAELDADRTRPIEAVASGGPLLPGLVGAYSFDAGSGDVVDDLSGHGNVGHMLGATWTPEGRFGNALRFDGSDAVVRVAPSPSLDLSTAMTLSAWIKPASDQSGWRAIVQRETDGYFLDASSAGPDRLGRFDDAIAAFIVVAAVWLGLSLAASGGEWLGSRRRRSWVIVAALALLGATVDALLAPSGSALAVALVALWLTASATSALEMMTFALVAVVCAVVTWTSLAHVDVSAVRLAADDGGAVRACLLGLLLLVTGVLRFAVALRSGSRRPPIGRACRSPIG